MSTRTVYVADQIEGTVIFIPVRAVWDSKISGMRVYINMHCQTAEIDSVALPEECLIGYRLVTGDEAEWILEMVKKYVEGLMATAEYHSRQPFPVQTRPEPMDQRPGPDREPDFDCPPDMANTIRKVWAKEDGVDIDGIGPEAIREALETLASKKRKEKEDRNKTCNYDDIL